MFFRTFFAAVSLSLAGAFHLAAGSVTLSWGTEPDTGAAGYRVYYGPASRNYTGMVDCGVSTSGTVTNLAPGSTYYFAVTAYGLDGVESDFSSEVVCTMPVAELSLVGSSGNQVVLSGAGIPGGVFDVLGSSDLSSWSTLGRVTADANGGLQFTDFGGGTNGARFYRVRMRVP